MDRLRARRRAAASRARGPRPAARPAPVLLEERKRGARAAADPRRRARLLGDLRLPQPRRPMARAALPGRLNWQVARVVDLVEETPRCTSLILEPPDWSG